MIDLANPIRGDLRDPAGNRVAGLLDAAGILGDNVRRTGDAEVGDPRAGGLFRPHDTLNWFEPGTVIDAERESRLIDMEALAGRLPRAGGPQRGRRR